MADNRDKIRIVHALRSLEFGGAEKIVLELAGLQKKGGVISPCLVCVTGGGPLQAEVEQMGLTWMLAGQSGIKYLSPIFRLARIFSRLKPDLVHTHNLVSHLHAAPAARLLGVPVVHTKHGKAVSSFSKFPVLRRFIYNLSERIVVVSRETGESFMARAGLDSSKIVTIHNGIDVDSFGGGRNSSLAEELGLEEGHTVFGSVSRLSRVKNHSTMVRAFAKVADRHENCRLLMVGDGPERGGIEKLVDKLSLREKVIFAGFRKDTAGCLSIMDLFLQPSLEEGLSLTILEAAAAGVPVVTSPVGGTPEIISDGATGFLVEPQDVEKLSRVMEMFLKDPGIFRGMAEQARKKVEDSFSLDSMERKYRELYWRILGLEGR